MRRQLTLRGVAVGRDLRLGVLVVDVGGGSTELVEPGDGFRISLELGCVRLTERFGDDVAGLRRAVAAVLAERVPDEVAVRVDTVVGQPAPSRPSLRSTSG